MKYKSDNIFFFVFNESYDVGLTATELFNKCTFYLFLYRYLAKNKRVGFAVYFQTEKKKCWSGRFIAVKIMNDRSHRLKSNVEMVTTASSKNPDIR